MKKVLFLSIPYMLEGVQHGKGALNGSTAIAEMLVAALSEFAEVTVVTDRPDRFACQRTVNVFRNKIVRADGFDAFWRRGFRVFGAPSEDDFSRDSIYKVVQLANVLDPDRFDGLLAETDCDIVILNRQEHFFLSRHPGLQGRQIIFFAHDSHYQRDMSFEKIYRMAQPLTHVEKAIERAFVAEAKRLVAISLEEQAHFSQVADECEVILFRPRIDKPQQLINLDQETPILFYFIGVNNFVNRQSLESAVRLFADHGRAGVDELHVFGSVCSAAAAVASNQGVFLHGHVDDFQDATAGMHVLLAPIQSGSGIPLKVAEALEAGHLVLASAFGAASYPEFIGTRIIVSDQLQGNVVDALCAALVTYAPYEEYARKNRQAVLQIAGVE